MNQTYLIYLSPILGKGKEYKVTFGVKYIICFQYNSFKMWHLGWTTFAVDVEMLTCMIMPPAFILEKVKETYYFLFIVNLVR